MAICLQTPLMKRQIKTTDYKEIQTKEDRTDVITNTDYVQAFKSKFSSLSKDTYYFLVQLGDVANQSGDVANLWRLYNIIEEPEE